MGASRTRQTRAVVSYRLDSSSDYSDDDASFTVQRSARNDSSRGNNNGELDAGNGKGRRTLALKKNKSQDREEFRQETRGQAHRGQHDQNNEIQQLDVSTHLVRSAVRGGFEAADGKSPPETKTSSFQHLVNVAFEATNAGKNDTVEDGGGAVECARQMQSSVAGEESAHQPSELEKSNSSHGDERDFKVPADCTLTRRYEAGRDAETSPTDTIRQRPKKSSKNHQAGSDDDSWLEDDVVDGDCSDSASDFSSKDTSDSDVDVERPAKKRQSTKLVAKKPQQSVSRISLSKGLRTKGGADQRVSNNSGLKAENKKTKPVGRPRKIVSPSGTSGFSLVEGSGPGPCIPRLQPVKLRLKMSGKESKSDGSPCGSTGGPPAQLTSPNNLPHRRVLGLSRRCRPPPLHPYVRKTT